MDYYTNIALRCHDLNPLTRIVLAYGLSMRNRDFELVISEWEQTAPVSHATFWRAFSELEQKDYIRRVNFGYKKARALIWPPCQAIWEKKKRNVNL